MMTGSETCIPAWLQR